MIIVCSLFDLKSVCESVKPSHVISVIDPGYEPKTPTGVQNHLKLGFDDITEVKIDNIIHRNSSTIDSVLIENQVLPNIDHINKIVEFLSTWDQSKPIVIHCWCGVSRSMATASFLICKLNKQDINRNVRFIRAIAPHANPNKLMIFLFEKYLKIDNKLKEAFEKYPHTINYNCATIFAPVTIFDIKELEKY